uniref:NADH dehydrogenase subunit 6 n=1 Tax=Argopistes sexvittatus TaxID=2995641 RepID=UPI00237B978A|nr:NADH dehydrogenase subunit 6 [Argopistes sexvittatus]WBV77040.1 NADH dehydrogenase subunit 6 [Argopistes sexvittatus]WBV77053.1 NADH dehydrogenase subunit 6 [Argopistes sexvittatus]
MFLMPLLMMNSLMLIFMKHPLSCGLMLLIQTIMTALITGLMNYNFWYSYILFLVMIGGMLILFIYMTSIASNEKFKFNMNLFKMMMLIFLLNMLLILIFDNFYFNTMNQLQEMMINKNYNNLSLMKYFNYPSYFIMIMLISYLFITLIAAVKMTKSSYGSLRQKF